MVSGFAFESDGGAGFQDDLNAAAGDGVVDGKVALDEVELDALVQLVVDDVERRGQVAFGQLLLDGVAEGFRQHGHDVEEAARHRHFHAVAALEDDLNSSSNNNRINNNHPIQLRHSSRIRLN